jgi:predicted Rdx family selenoprotein
MAAAIRRKFSVDTQLIAGGGGIFDIARDGGIIFSKGAAGRFPEENEVLQLLLDAGD